MNSDLTLLKRKTRISVLKSFTKITGSERLQRSEKLIERLMDAINLDAVDSILGFWSMQDEVHTHDFIREMALTKKVYLPRIRENSLDIVRFRDDSDMAVHPNFQILEPKGEKELGDFVPDLILVPGVAFDREKRRLGRGKGFYDRLLSLNTDLNTVSLCFDFQLVHQVPFGNFDRKVKTIISESEILI